MSTRGSAIVRVVTYFRECHIDEARVAFKLVQEVVEGRLKTAKRTKQPQATAAATPRRRRRTKAEMAAEKTAKATGSTQGALTAA